MDKFIQIGESLHASIKATGEKIRQLWQAGPEAFSQPSAALEYLTSLIANQAQQGADYIAVNVDDLAQDDEELARATFCALVKLIRRHSQVVPVCIDSGDDRFLLAGLRQWYADAPDDIAVPLINSVKTYTADELLPYNKEYKFKFIALLMEETPTAGPVLPEKMLEMAREIHRLAVEKYGFSSADIFFDTAVYPLAIDMPMTPDVPGFTYCTFNAARLIMSDPQLQGVHSSLGLSNCAKDLPVRRIGLCRAYLAVARKYLLDAAIVNVAHDYKNKPAASELVELVEAFAQQDGSMENTNRALQLMGDFCRSGKK